MSLTNPLRWQHIMYISMVLQKLNRLSLGLLKSLQMLNITSHVRKQYFSHHFTVLHTVIHVNFQYPVKDLSMQ
ncbi:hypothetical protein ACJX0J_008773, partial [Zea mays]